MTRIPWRSVRATLATAVVLTGVMVLGGLVTLLPITGLRCPAPGAWVVLDPGHGGDDPGAVNEQAGLAERDLVLDIAHRTKALLTDAGYSAALTRNDNATGYANTPRGTIANLCHAVAYVSIHLNSFDQPEPNYAKTFWGQEEKDAAFAAVMQAALVGELQPGTDLGDSGLEQLENGGLLTARMPAVLIEPLFLSHPQEAERLATPDGERREAIAHAVTQGIDVWLRMHGLGPVPDPTSEQPMMREDALLGPARGSSAQVLATALLSGAARSDQLWAYVTEVYRLAPEVGLDPAIVVAQSALETGWWQSEAWIDQLNPAGIGVTGSEVTGPTWTSGTEAARAQLVHLYLYAAGPIPHDHPLAPYIELDPRYEPALSAGRAGVAPTIADLSERWATDPNYGDGIARVGNRLFGAR
jgi:N-acetylmuramoyl-L-alanine amidase